MPPVRTLQFPAPPGLQVLLELPGQLVRIQAYQVLQALLVRQGLQGLQVLILPYLGRLVRQGLQEAQGLRVPPVPTQVFLGLRDRQGHKDLPDLRGRKETKDRPALRDQSAIQALPGRPGRIHRFPDLPDRQGPPGLQVQQEP